MQPSGIASIVISENPVTLLRTGFMDNLILGKNTAWADNSYTHEIRAMGGFWKCKFDLMPNRLGIGYLMEYLENGLGREVRSYTTNEGPAWEGLISKLELKYPGGSIKVSLLDMANRTWVRYLSAEGGLIKRSTVQNDTASQTKFGIKEEVLAGAIISDGEETTFTGRPAVSGDDGYSTAPATFDNNDNFTVFGQAGGVVDHSFFRVPNVTIPPGATIVSAKITCKAFNAQVGNTIRLNIYMNDHDDAVAPTSFAELAALDLTTAFSAWDSEENWVENTTYDSPDFTDAIQEVIDRDSWASGNAMMVLVKDDGSDNGAIRAPDSQDLGETTATLLTITYSLAGNVATQLAATYLAKYADPGRSRINVNLSRMALSGVRLKVSCIGYFRTLNWRTYNKVTAHTGQNVNLQIGDINTAVGQFISSADLATNTSQVSQEYDRDDLAGDLILGLTRMADSSNNRFICGVYEDRVLKYEQSKTLSSESDIKYKIRIRDNERVIREVATNRSVSPAALRPNDWLRVVDVLSGDIRTSTDIKKDPQVTLIESVTFSEPDGLTIPGNRAVQIDNLMAKAGFGGVSQI